MPPWRKRITSIASPIVLRIALWFGTSAAPTKRPKWKKPERAIKCKPAQRVVPLSRSENGTSLPRCTTALQRKVR